MDASLPPRRLWPPRPFPCSRGSSLASGPVQHLSPTTFHTPPIHPSQERILDVLLGVEGASDLDDLVAQACSPDPPGHALDEDEEALSTTPMQLLQAASTRLAALRAQHGDAGGVGDEEASQGGAGKGDERLEAQAAALVRVREACARLWTGDVVLEVQRARD